MQVTWSKIFSRVDQVWELLEDIIEKNFSMIYKRGLRLITKIIWSLPMKVTVVSMYQTEGFVEYNEHSDPRELTWTRSENQVKEDTLELDRWSYYSGQPCKNFMLIIFSFNIWQIWSSWSKTWEQENSRSSIHCSNSSTCRWKVTKLTTPSELSWLSTTPVVSHWDLLDKSLRNTQRQHPWIKLSHMQQSLVSLFQDSFGFLKLWEIP